MPTFFKQSEKRPPSLITPLAALLFLLLPLAGCRIDADKALTEAERIVTRWENQAARRKLTPQDSKDAHAQVDEWRRRYGDTFTRLTPEQLSRCAAVETRMSRLFGP